MGKPSATEKEELFEQTTVEKSLVNLDEYNNSARENDQKTWLSEDATRELPETD